jgi:hypothetical protein
VTVILDIFAAQVEAFWVAVRVARASMIKADVKHSSFSMNFSRGTALVK